MLFCWILDIRRRRLGLKAPPPSPPGARGGTGYAFIKKFKKDVYFFNTVLEPDSDPALITENTSNIGM